MTAQNGTEHMMTVAGLIELLQTIENPDQVFVVLQKDSEGNGFSPLAGVGDVENYSPDSTWSGEIVSNEDLEDEGTDEDGFDPISGRGPADNDDLESGDEDDGDEDDGLIPVVVLWPVG